MEKSERVIVNNEGGVELTTGTSLLFGHLCRYGYHGLRTLDLGFGVAMNFENSYLLMLLHNDRFMPGHDLL